MVVVAFVEPWPLEAIDRVDTPACGISSLGAGTSAAVGIGGVAIAGATEDAGDAPWSVAMGCVCGTLEPVTLTFA